MNYLDITESSVDGEGIRAVLFVSGCSEACEGCHNKASWDYKAGMLFEMYAFTQLEGMLKQDHIQGLTLSGGHPLADKNYKTVFELCKLVKTLYPHKDIWVYTGYTLEQIQAIDKKEILKYVDVLVDGRYDAALKDASLLYRGSSNQRVLRKGQDY